MKRFIATFESDNREVYAKRNEIVAALGLTPGMAVADVGAGTGLFTRLFAEKVGPTGKVYAVDIAPEFLAHIAAEARKRGQSNVVTVLGSQESTDSPAGIGGPGVSVRCLSSPGEAGQDTCSRSAGH